MQNQINVNIEPDDEIQCECGSKDFLQVFKLARKSIIIGDNKIHYAGCFKCKKCNKMVDSSMKTKREMKNETSC